MIKQVLSKKTGELFNSQKIGCSLDNCKLSEQVLRVFGKPVQGIEKISYDDIECVVGGRRSIRRVVEDILVGFLYFEVIKIGCKIYAKGGFSKDGKGIISKGIRKYEYLENKLVDWLS